MKEKLGRSQRLYVVQAALEYLIALAASGTFLAKLTSQMGMSDSLTGILTSMMSMGCLFQMLALFIRVRHVKIFVILTSLFSQFLFMLIYLLPLTGVSPEIKTAAFVAALSSAHLVLNAASPYRMNWLMGLVSDSSRGSFSATMEMFSLLMGILFSYGMGAVFDHLEADGRLQTALVVMAMVITVCMLLHALVLTLVEKPAKEFASRNARQMLRSLAGSANLRKIIGAYIGYQAITHVAVPFYATYQLHELGFSLKTVALLVIAGDLARMLVSKAWGRYADRTSFGVMVEKCFWFLGLSFLCGALATPRNGVVMFALYYIFHGIAMGGTNSGIRNLIFAYMPEDARVGALAVCPAVGGMTGFAATLLFGAVLSHMQAGGVNLFGMPLYAQQALSLLSLPLTALSILYLRTQIIGKMQRENN